MKPYLFIAVFFITSVISSKADVFLIEGDNREDIARVANTFIYFYTQNEEKLSELKECGFDKKLCREFIATFRTLHPENPLCHIEGKKQALRSCFSLGQYLKNKPDLIKGVVGGKNYNLFTWGVFYTYFLLKAL